MDNSKVITLFRTFSKREIQMFEKYLNSPYFGCKKFTLNLFLELRNYYPDLTELNRKEIFEKSFPGKNYNDSLLRKTLSLLYQYAIKFISLKLLESEPELEDFMFINYARTHSLFKLCGKHLEEFNKEKQNEEIHMDYFYYLYMVEREKVFYKLAAFSQKDACKDVVSRNEIMLLDFIIKFSLGLYEMNANKSSFNFDYVHSPAYIFYKNFDPEKFISEISLDDKYSFIYEISSHLLKLTFSSKPDAYYELKQVVMKHYHKLHLSLTFGLFTILSSYSVHKFPKEHFEINRFLVEKGFYLKIGAYFQLKDFIRTFKAAISADEPEWAEKFLSEYKKYLNPVHKDNTEIYCRALTDYYRKDYESALRSLSKVKYQLFSFKQDVYIMGLQIHYELGNHETAFSLTDSYRHFLRENKLVDENSRDRYNFFMKCYAKLFKAKLNNDKISAGLLKADLQKESNAAGREWLGEKIEELI
jgi:hypothetical protein